MKFLSKQEEMILLAVLNLKENAYLVTIKEYLAKITGKNLTIGAIYVPLNRLKLNGYLKTRIGEPNANRGPNEIQFYNLTEKGFEILNEVQKVNADLWIGFSELSANRTR